MNDAPGDGDTIRDGGRTDDPMSGGEGLDRREWLGRTGTILAAFALGPSCTRPVPTRRSHAFPGFRAIPRSHRDAIALPAGYEHQVFVPWGTWLDGTGRPFDMKASAADQQRQVGTHHDGMSYFPIDAKWNHATQRLEGSSTHGYLVVNHEYADEGFLHAAGTRDWSAEHVDKSKASVGVSVLQVKREDGAWRLVQGRRVSGLDEVEIGGPARGHGLMKTRGEHSTPGERAGTSVTGTMGNCANGQTPWGTYLTCEENIQDYFGRTEGRGGELEDRMVRYGIGKWASREIEGTRSIYGWELHDPRFDADVLDYRNHSHRYGWVVEIDPFDTERKPIKRTALGRFRHENAAVVVAPDDRIVVYLGDDQEFEYVYKYVSDGKFMPPEPGDDEAEQRRKREHNLTLLDQGKLYAARFDRAGKGRWEVLDHQRPELRDEFESQAEVVIFARRAADLVHATDMDRPEWVAFDQDPTTRLVRNVFVTLTNNYSRGKPGRLGPNPANPRAENVYGQIVRWQEDGGDPTATTFGWQVFVACGNREHDDEANHGDIVDAKQMPDQDYGSPDGMWFDPRGILWVQTDVSRSKREGDDYVRFGNNQMFAVDPESGATKRFMVGPRGCELTGIAMTPDARTMFVNAQHPGEPTSGFGNPDDALAVSSWPGGTADGRPRSATVIITRTDGDPIGK